MTPTPDALLSPAELAKVAAVVAEDERHIASPNFDAERWSGRELAYVEWLAKVLSHIRASRRPVDRTKLRLFFKASFNYYDKDDAWWDRNIDALLSSGLLGATGAGMTEEPDEHGETSETYEEIGRTFMERYRQAIDDPICADFICADGPVEIIDHLFNKIDEMIPQPDGGEKK